MTRATTHLSAAGIRRATAGALALLVVSFGLAWHLAPAQAAVPGASEQPGGGRMVMVLDSSGSMKERAAGGETKIAAAKKALGQVIGSLPEDQSVGLRVYGAKVFSRDQAGACTDSQLVVPVDIGNRDQLRSAVRSYKPYGETPIGYALQEAAKDLGGEGKRTIVLVSDGEATCAPDPCQVARDLSKKGVDLKVDVVGLDVDGAARQKLQCIAGAGNGTYYDVDSSEEFAASLEKLATRAARPFAAIGQPVAGTPTADGAPTITAGDWVDGLGTTETELTKNYVIERATPGSTLHVSASLRTASPAGEKVDVQLATPQGDDCSFDSAFTQLSAGQLISAGSAADNIDTFGEVAPDDPCVTSDTIIATVDNSATTVTGPRPLEIRVVEEPPVETPADLPARATDAAWFAPGSGAGSPTSTTGGSSFADAPLLEPGRYRDAILPGEVLVYQVELGWGQQLAAQVDFPRPTAKLAAAIGNYDMTTSVDLFGPTRRLATTNGAGAPPNESFLPNAALTTGAFTSPVTYLNRTGDGAESGAALAGRYTVAVFLEEDPDRESYLVPFTLDLGVKGEETGEPTYTEAAVNPDSQAPDREPAVGDADSEPDTDSGSISGVVIGGLGLVALLAAGFVVLRRRSG